MILADMASFICSKVGQIDPTSVALCKGFLGARYKMIWDSYFWQDSQMIVEILVNASTASVNYPANMDRVITIMCADPLNVSSGGTVDEINGHFLDPVDLTFILESEPDVYGSFGDPKFYDDTTDPNTFQRSITLYPTTNAPKLLVFFGKRIVPQFVNDSDIQQLRNCDNVIIAYAMGDMLERQRQYGKAQLKFQEAAALLETAKSVEHDQANQPRKTKALTVAGNSLAEMTDAVSGICGLWTPDYQILIRDSLRRNYQSVYDSNLWPEAMVMVTQAVQDQQVIMPHYVDRVVAVRGVDDIELWPAEISLYFRLDATLFDQTGSAIYFSMLTPVAVSILPPTTQALLLSSSSHSDTGKVFVRGETNGIEQTEQVTLNGTIPVSTIYLYDTPITIAKGVTNGDLSVVGAVSHITFEVIPAAERERKHQRIWLMPPPTPVLAGTGLVTTPSNCVVLAKRKIQPLVSDQDTPIITGCQNVLISMAAADILARTGKTDLAQARAAQAEAEMKNLMSLNRDQNAYNPRFIPQVEPWMANTELVCPP